MSKQKNNLGKLILYTLLIFLLLIIFFALGTFFGSYYKLSLIPLKIELSTSTSFTQINEVVQRIKSFYYKDVSTEKLIQGALRGIVDSLDDPYSSYLTPQEFQAYQEMALGKYEGVGLEIGSKNNKIVVIAPIEGTPAYKAGIKADDQILKINNTPTQGMTVQKAVSLIRGNEGTSVKLATYRPSTKTTTPYTLIREFIQFIDVTSKVVDENLGYVKLRGFNMETGNNARKAVKELLDKKVKGIILDLRNNPGGLLNISVNVASIFIEKGKIVTTKEKGKADVIFNARVNAYENIPLVVLVNKGSASASEIVAGAIQDRKRGILVGEKTFGKALIQSSYRLSDGSAMVLTIGEYFTPSGKNINKVGLTPDVLIEASKDETTDTQLDKAISVLKDLIEGKVKISAK